jgi:hypothetical protein
MNYYFPMKKNKILIFFYLILFEIAGRLIPHPANFTPTTSLCIFSSQKLPRKIALIIAMISIAISDILLSYIYGYPLFGSWSFFTYTGFAAITLIASIKKIKKIKTLLFYVIFSELSFWLWTNFGCWLCGHLTTVYPKNLTGLITCYAAALPFLRNALLGSLVWMIVIFGCYSAIPKKSAAIAGKTS